MQYPTTCLWCFLRHVILEAKVDVNIGNAQNTTTLHVALNRGANTCVGLLLAAGQTVIYRFSGCVYFFPIFDLLVKC
jgi:ankyrin repeat protein